MRRLMLLLATALLASLCACGRNEETDWLPTAPSPGVVYDTITPEPDISTAEPPTTSNEDETMSSDPSAPSIDDASEPAVEIEWTEITYPFKTLDDYTYDISLKLSPWILLSNDEIINAAWDEVGNGKALPGFNNWGLTLYLPQENGYNRTDLSFATQMTDMYYCIGTMEITNTTEGWPIDADNPRSVNPWAVWNGKELANGSTDMICRVFYSNKTTDSGRGRALNVNASMSKDTWGPVTFIIMAPENISPKYPD